MFSTLQYIIVLCALGAGGALSLVLWRKDQEKRRQAEAKKEKMLIEAKAEAEDIREKARAKIDQVKKEAREDNQRLQQQLNKAESILKMKNEILDRRQKKNRVIKDFLDGEVEAVKKMRQNTTGLDQKIEEKLLEITALTKEDAQKELIRHACHDIILDKENYLKKDEEIHKDIARKEAEHILRGAIQKYSAATATEKFSSTVEVKRDVVKGYIVGKEGQNIVLFEELLEVDVIFNDQPRTITVSSPDLVKREIAVSALKKLVKERVVTLDKIRHKIKDAEQEMAKKIRTEGQKIAQKLGLEKHPPDFIRILGRLKFRSSYGQNILKHSYEVSAFATMLASELNANIEICRIAGFLHDIGKAVDFELEGAHDDLGKELLEKYGFSEEIVHAVYAHHEKVPCKTIEAMLVKASDAISAGRPGARQESLDRYLERLHALEDTALKFKGVKKAFAISAGREVRIIVEPEEIDDSGVKELAHNVAEEVEEKLTYPGKIKVNVIRRTRAIDYAK